MYKQEVQQIYNEKSDVLLKDFPYYMKKYILNLKSAKTRYNHLLILKYWMEWNLNSGIIESYELPELERITDYHIVKYLDELSMSNVSSTIMHKKAVIQGFMEYLCIHEYIVRNPVKMVAKNRFKEKVGEHIVKIPTSEEMEDFLTNINNIKNSILKLRWKAVIAMFLGTGIRSEELIGLDVDDVMLEGEYSYITVIGKGNQRNKTKVALSQKRIPIIKEYMKWRINQEVETKALFLSNRNQRLSKSALDDFFKKYSERHISPHMLRHLYGSKLYSDTNDAQLVARQLRHSDIRTTMSHYVHGDDVKFYAAVSNM